MHNKIFGEIYLINEQIAKINELIKEILKLILPIQLDIEVKLSQYSAAQNAKLEEVQMSVTNQLTELISLTTLSVNNRIVPVETTVRTLTNKVNTLTSEVNGTEDRDGIIKIAEQNAAAISVIDAKIDGAISNVAMNQNSIQSMLAGIAETKSLIDAKIKPINEVLTATIAKIDDVQDQCDTRDSQMSTTISGINSRIDNNAGNIAATNRVLGTYGETLNTAAETMASNNAAIQALTTSVNTMIQHYNQMSTRLDNTDSLISSMHASIQNVEKRIDDFGDKFPGGVS